MTKQELFMLADSLRNQANNTMTVSYISESKVNQIINRYLDQMEREDIIKYLFHLVDKKELIITEELIGNLHRMIGNNEIEGGYRTTPVQVYERKQMPPEPEEVPRLMEHFIGQISTSKNFFHPIEFSAYVYKRFLDIYPFEQYNEEVAYYLLNLILIHSGYDTILVNPLNEQGYSEAMRASQHVLYPNMEPLVTLVAGCVVKELS